jgi:hypothetical protein
MNIQNQLTPEEWKTLVEAPIKAGKAMIFASPSGPIGVVKETSVLLNSVKKVTNTPSKSSFLGMVGKHLHDRKTDHPREPPTKLQTWVFFCPISTSPSTSPSTSESFYKGLQSCTQMDLSKQITEHGIPCIDPWLKAMV